MCEKQTVGFQKRDLIYFCMVPLNLFIVNTYTKQLQEIHWFFRSNYSRHIYDILAFVAVSLTTSITNVETPGRVLPYITYTGMCRPTGSWFWSSWFRTGYPFQRRFLEQGIKNCGSRLYLLLKIVADYEEAFIWCISRTNKEMSF